MAFDLSRFASEIGMADEDRTALDALFGKYATAAGKLEGIFSAEVDARLAPLRAEVDRKQAEADAQLATLTNIRDTDSQAYEAAQTKAEKLQGELAVLRSRFERVGQENGIDVAPYLKDIVANPNPNPNPNPAAPKTPTIEELSAEANRAALTSFETTLLLDDIATRHRDVFGAPLSKTEVWTAYRAEVRRTQNPNLSIEGFWKSKYNVDAKVAENTEKSVQQRITDAVTAATTKLQDEAALRGPMAPPPTQFEGSPALAALTKDRKPTHVNGMEESVVLAIADYRQQHAERLAKKTA